MLMKKVKFNVNHVKKECIMKILVKIFAKNVWKEHIMKMKVKLVSMLAHCVLKGLITKKRKELI